MTAVRHDAFISYRHGADAIVAEAIERALERIAKPWNRLRAMSVFRDQSDLGAETDLTAAITRTLDDTRFLVLIASPESAASPWVEKEVAHWCDRRGGAHDLIVILTGGELGWDEPAGAFSPTSTALSPAVRSRFTTEPLFVDLRWARDVPQLSLHDSRFRSAMVLVAATIRGVAPADLESEDVRLHRRARRLARAALATMAVLAVAASVAAVVAVNNGRRADQRARDALGRQLGLVALDMPDSEADQAFLLSLVAADLDSGDGAERFQASRALIGRYSRLEKLLRAPPGTSSLRGVAMSPDGARIVATTTHGETAALLAWPAGSRSDPTMTPLPADVGVAPSVSFLADGRLLVGDQGSAFVTVSDDGGDIAVLAHAVAVDAHRGLAAVATPAGSIELVALGSGETLAHAANAAGRVDLRFGRAAIASEEDVVVVDGEAGSSARAALGATAGDVTALAVGPSDDVAAVTASGGDLVSWRRSTSSATDSTDLDAGRDVAAPEQIGQPERLVAAPDGARVLVIGEAGSAVVRLESGEVDGIDVGATGRVALDPSGRYAAVGGARLTIWDLATGRATFAVPRPVNAMAWSGCADGSACRLATVGESLDVWDPDSRRHVELLGQSNAQAVTISTDGSSVVTGGWGANAALWQLRPIIDDAARVEIDVDEATTPAANGTRRVEWREGSALVADVSTGERIELDRRCAVDPGGSGGPHGVSPRGGYVVVHQAQDGTTAVCSTHDGVLVAWSRFAGESLPADAVAVDDDGNVVLGGGAGYIANFRRDGAGFEAGSAIDVRLGGERVDITSLATREGTIAAGVRPAAAAALARVFVWPYAAGGTPTHFESDYRTVPAVALIGSGADHVVTAGRDADGGPIVLQIWEAENSRRLGRALAGLSGDVVALRGGDTTVVAADSAGNAFRWDLDEDPTRDVCEIVGRHLGPDEWRELAGGALQPFDYEPVCPAAVSSNPVTTTAS